MPAFDDLELLTERLRLRPLREADAPALLALFSDPEVMRYWGTPAWTSIEQAHELIAEDEVAMREGAHVRLGIERRSDAVFLGTCSLFHLMPACRRAELGYALSSTAWGHGYMHEALVALVDYAFSELGLNRLEADIDPRNDASARSLERLGFQKEGYLPERWIVDGVVSDTAFYGLLAREWRSSRGTLGGRTNEASKEITS